VFCLDTIPLKKDASVSALYFPPFRLRGALLAACTSLALVGVHNRALAQPAVPMAEPKALVAPEIDLSWPILRFLLQAEVFMRQGEGAKASDMFLELARRTRDARLGKRAVEAALSVQDLTRAQAAAQMWAQLAPNEAAIKNLQDSLQLQTGDPVKNEALLARRLQEARAAGTLDEGYNQLRSVLMRASDKKQSLVVLDRLSAEDLGNLTARLTRAELAFVTDDLERALSETQAARKIDPSNERAVMTQVQILSRDPKRNKEAIAALEDYLLRQPSSQTARFALARQYMANEQPALARAQYEKLEKDNPNDAGLLLALAQSAYQGKSREQAKGFLERYIALPSEKVSDKGTAFLFLSDIHEEDKRLDLALKSALDVPAESGQYFLAQNRRAAVLSKLKRTDEALQVLNAIQFQGEADRLRVVQTRAMVQRNAGRHEEAFTALMAGFQDAQEQPDLLYDLGMAAEKLKKFDIMEASLRKLIQLRPESAQAYNALGYSLADHHIKLDEAQQLIQKALLLAPNDSHIIDSLGWVFFRKGNKVRALQELRRAYQASPEPDIGAHLGEVLWVSGQREEARKLWRAAKQKEPSNDTLLETLKRLKVTGI
jgi:tetratricopeptide (TPR) repeat protein